MLKIIIWILVIWVVISLVQGTIKEGTGWMAPFIAEYKIQLRERPVVTLAVTVIVLFILFKLLF